MKLFKDHREIFPDPSFALEEGIVAVSDEIDTDILFEAYSFGIFPWPHEGFPILWFCPPMRGILDFAELHVSKSLRKAQRKSGFEVTFNQNFSQVITECSDVPRPGQDGTWITKRLRSVYEEFHDQGFAHSVECWEKGRLVGGLYGVYVAGVFCGESMFHHKDNASKIALLALIEQLESHGLSWLDIQMVTPHLKKMGGKYLPRSAYLERLEKAKKQARPLKFKS